MCTISTINQNFVFRFIKTKFDIQTQKNSTAKYAKRAPARLSIHNGHKQFMETGTLPHKPRNERPRISLEGIERIRQLFSRSSTKSIPLSCGAT